MENSTYLVFIIVCISLSTHFHISRVYSLSSCSNLFYSVCIGGATGRAPCMNPGKHSMLKIQRCAQVPVGIKTNPSSHTTEVWDVHMARRAEAIIAITMNNKLRQEWGSAG